MDKPKPSINHIDPPWPPGTRESFYWEAEKEMEEPPLKKNTVQMWDYDTKEYEEYDLESRSITYHTQKPYEELSGLDGQYYKLPGSARELQDLIEYKNMNFNVGNIFKAAYRLGDKPGVSKRYDLEKILFYAQRELDRLEE